MFSKVRLLQSTVIVRTYIINVLNNNDKIIEIINKHIPIIF